MGRRGGESVRAADTSRTLRGHFETPADCPAATPGVGKIHPNRRSVASAGPSPEAAHESTWVADQSIQLSSTLGPAPPHTARTHPAHALAPAPPRPHTPEQGSSASTPNTRRGCGVGARRPRNPALQWGGACANPSGWWMGVSDGFRMGLPRRAAGVATRWQRRPLTRPTMGRVRAARSRPSRSAGSRSHRRAGSRAPWSCC